METYSPFWMSRWDAGERVCLHFVGVEHFLDIAR